MEIRYLNREDDLLALSNIYESSWKSAYKGIIPQAYLDGIPKGRWASIVTKEGMHSLVVIRNGRMIGTACFCRSRWKAYSAWGEIVSIYFLPDETGKGYGKQLLKKCMEELNRFGFEKILLWVLEDNTNARAFYEKNGMHCSSEFREDQIGGKKLREVMYTNC